MPRIQIDVNAHNILVEYRALITADSIDGADFSDAIRLLKTTAETAKEPEP